MAVGVLLIKQRNKGIKVCLSCCAVAQAEGVRYYLGKVT
jgi:hypothetical protein